MARVEHPGGYIEFDGKVRIDRGAERQVRKATKTLMGSGTLPPGYVVNGVDANGKVIEIGQPMTFIDFRDRDRYLWKIYVIDNGRWIERDARKDKAEAEARALEILGGLG